MKAPAQWTVAASAAAAAHLLVIWTPVPQPTLSTEEPVMAFDLVAEPAALPEPTPPAAPRRDADPAPAGPPVEEPAGRTSVRSSRPDDPTPDELVPVVTGLPVPASPTESAAPAERIGNTSAPGYDATVPPEQVRGFAGGGSGGGGRSAAGAVGGGTAGVPAVLRKLHRPAYPRALVNSGVEGRVELRVEVLRNGRAGRAEVVRGTHPELDRAALDALRRFRWYAATEDGRRVDSWVTLVVRFVIMSPDRAGRSSQAAAPEPGEAAR